MRARNSTDTAIDSVLQQLLMCRTFLDGMEKADPNRAQVDRRAAVVLLREFCAACRRFGADNHEVDATGLRTALSELMDRTQASDPCNVMRELARLLVIQGKDFYDKPVYRIAARMRHARRGTTDYRNFSFLPCAPASSLLGSLHLAKPQFFDPDALATKTLRNYPQMIAVRPKPDPHKARLAANIRAPRSFIAGNGAMYTLTGMIFALKGDGTRYVSCVRTFGKSGWLLCGAGERNERVPQSSTPAEDFEVIPDEDSLPF